MLRDDTAMQTTSFSTLSADYLGHGFLFYVIIFLKNGLMILVHIVALNM
jgi:hypothetical protein